MPAGYRLWMSADGTVMLRMWNSGLVEVATRSDAGAVWGPPVALEEEE